MSPKIPYYAFAIQKFNFDFSESFKNQCKRFLPEKTCWRIQYRTKFDFRNKLGWLIPGSYLGTVASNKF